jgi:hypothetical protein
MGNLGADLEVIFNSGRPHNLDVNLGALKYFYKDNGG